MLEKAKKNLKDLFLIIGLTEKFDETMLLLKKALKWRFPFYIKENVAQKRPSSAVFSNETLAIIKEHNAFDIDLYTYASKKLNKLVAQQSVVFKMQLVFFKLFNFFYAYYYNIYFRIWNRIWNRIWTFFVRILKYILPECFYLKLRESWRSFPLCQDSFRH